MQSSDDGNTRYFLNIFLREFLERLGAHNEPRAAAEADAAGPWCVEEVRATLYAVFRKGESTVRGDRPAAVLYDRTPALLLAALLPGTGRDPLFHLRPDPTPEGYAIESGGEVLGHLHVFDDQLIQALHILECLLRSPEGLANLLEAAGAVALERAGRILGERVQE